MQYIQEAKEEPEGGGCVFCAIPDTEAERVLARGELTYVVLNKFPYNPGHLLVVPLRHVGDLEEVTQEENVELQAFLQRAVGAIRRAADPHGFNVGLNLGRIAGAGIPEHLHWHVVPRWSGDTNFMSVVGDTRVLPELLAETYGRLKSGFEG
ncbi:MAG: HIT domain-containing protein [Actinomycetota bacterium]